jgi:tol-pal system protein YbgF
MSKTKDAGREIDARISSSAVNSSTSKKFLALALAATAVGMDAGCASRADVVDVRNTQVQMRAALADQNQEIEELKRRYEALRTQVGDPKGRPGQRSMTSDQLARSIDDLNRRVSMLEQGQPLAPTAPPLEGMSPEAVPNVLPPTGQPPAGQVVALPTPAPASNPMQAALAREEASLQGTRPDPAYSAALQQIRGGDCKQAVASLRDFVRKNPKSPLADNSQYWVGSCYYQQKDFNRAIIELNEVLLKYPKGDKVPAALLLLADAFKDSGDSIDARLILQKLVNDHPNTPEAQQGRAKLDALGD